MKRPKILLIASLAVILVFQVLVLNHAHAVNNQGGNDATGCESKINLPWQEFKELLKLDKDEIVLTLKEMNRLLQQTDPKLKPEYRLIEGRVILSRTEFKRILDHMKALPRDEAAPVRDYLIKPPDILIFHGLIIAQIEYKFPLNSCFMLRP